ncbi:PilZ domain-containing protein [bacterium]|nr:PilZ domain-containing protein [bacterium]
MISVKGTYENGTIKLLEPIKIEGDANVVITFLDDDFPLPASPANAGPVDSLPLEMANESDSDEFYEKLRRHKRYKARGNITIIWENEELTFPLNDYSAGGLSFFSDMAFDVGERITAALKYDASGEILVMNFEITVRGVFEDDDLRYKIGCQFIDDVDEELWHTIMG